MPAVARPAANRRSTAAPAPHAAAVASAAAVVSAVAAGAAFALFPLLRPWGDKAGSLPEMASAFASPAWVLAHLLGMTGWVLLVVLAVARWRAQGGGGARAAWLMGIGAALVLPYYGAETFALNALGAAALEAGDPSIVAAQESIRFAPVPAVMFALGLILLGIGAVLLARAATGRARPAAVVTAALVVLYLPQFFLPAPGRVLHGLLLGAALAWWALSLRRSTS